ncbi:hypothetical protein [Methylobacterium gossipiicola]|uniref:Uncharacterized protein n=1 Tax=Methylobacterium gossipiicola TaxID=582675 RepID=A0A1I2T7K8_9HYPH|nr:hypothetical protein [Methylobacterium gossipiicola]SFG60875.1 hypothetical protein SAMN05192565_106171 [Methylobacterium gossipiicola]
MPAAPAGIADAVAILHAHAPRLAPDVSRTLAALLAEVEAVPAGAGLSLNADGGAVEFACSSLSADLRYVVDFGGAVRTRLARIADWLAAHGAGAGDLAAARRLQAQGAPRWGAWLGVRHRPGAPPAFKVYVEVPPGTEPGGSGLIHPPGWPEQDGTALRPLLVGLGPEEGAREFYFEGRARGMPVARLAGLLGRLGLAEHLEDLVALVGAFEFRRGGGRLPDIRFGFSERATPTGPPVFSLIAFAQDFAGGDAELRAALLRCADRRGFDLGPYADLTASFAARPAGGSRHNMITFLVGAGIGPGLQVSFRPPALSD